MENKELTPEQEERAAIELWNAACQFVFALHDMAQKRPDLLRPIARQVFFWPGIISGKRAFDTVNAKLMEKIELGAAYSSKQWRPDQAATQFAIKLWVQVSPYAKQLGLPPLTTKKNKRTWFEKTWNYAVNDLGIKPEKNPHLAKFAKRAKDRNYKADERAAARERVWQAFDKLIPVQRRTK